jgi:hypothetical protein
MNRSRPSMPRPRSAATLLSVAIVLAVPGAASAQAPDPAEMQAELETALETAVQGGIPAPPDLSAAPDLPAAPDPLPEPTAPASAPEPSAAVPDPIPEPALEPVAQLLSETATAPAPESAPQPSAPTGPTNINVDIRILSPGDNGDVVQEIGDVIQEIEFPGAPLSRDAPAGAGEGFTWNWIWNWESGCTPDRRVASTWNWVWDWEGGCGGAPGFPDVPDVFTFAPDVPGLASEPQELPAAPAESVAEHDLALALDEPQAHTKRALVPGRAGRESASDTLTAPTGSEAVRAAALTEARPHRTTSPDEDRSAPARMELPAAPLPLAAATSVAGGAGSPVPVAIALLALLCLLAPRALEPAFAGSRKLSSLLSSSRLERPG